MDKKELLYRRKVGAWFPYSPLYKEYLGIGEKEFERMAEELVADGRAKKRAVCMRQGRRLRAFFEYRGIEFTR